MIEMVVVLLLMSIIAATVLGRSISTSDMDLNSETDKIRNHLRFAQSEAMKRSNTVWGIKSFGTEYWLFRNNNPDNPANEVRLPGVVYSGASNRISEADIGGVTLSDFTIFFDRIGKPYTAYTDETTNTALAGPLSISVSGRPITITPETGLIR
jgi:type II secretory pathway pseudopilin PulG